MTEREYRAHPAISRSDLWTLRQSPEKFKWEREHPSPPTPALLLGQATHKLLLQPESFDEEFAVAPALDRRTAAGKAAWAEWAEAAEGKTIITPDMMEHARAMAGAVLDCDKAVKLLQGAKEQAYFWKETTTGEACKCRVDCLNTSLSSPVIIDFKTAADASTESFMRAAVSYGYDFQSGMYTDGAEANIGDRPRFVFIVVEKDPPYAVNILQADELFVCHGIDVFRDLIGIYHDCKQADDWYGYLGKQNAINTLALPSWVANSI